MVWGCMSAAGTGMLQFIEGTMPTCTVTYWSRAWSPPFGHWAAGKCSNMITTTALLKKLRVKVTDWPSMCPDLNPSEHLWGILKRKVKEHKVSNIHQLRDVVMEEWKRNPVVTCEALVNSMPKRVKAVLENNDDHAKYWHFGHNLEYIIIFYIYNLFIFFPLSVGDTLDVLLYYLLLIGCFTCCFII